MPSRALSDQLSNYLFNLHLLSRQSVLSMPHAQTCFFKNTAINDDNIANDIVENY